MAAAGKRRAEEAEEQPEHAQSSQQEEITHDEPATENTPLLPRQASADEEGATTKTSRMRWPSLIALILLISGGIAILLLVFIAPDIVKQYAEQAVVFEPQSVSIDSFTTTGVRARVQGSFRLDARRVSEDPVRNLGRFFTYIASEVETGASDVEVSLPEYGNVLLGVAHVPPIKVSIRNGEWNFIDFLADLEPGDVDGIRTIANDWIDGRLGQIRVLGKANVPIKSGLVSIGAQEVVHELLLSGGELPSIPEYDIQSIKVREIDVPADDGNGTKTAVVADAVISVQNDYPVDLTIPTLHFEMLVDACTRDDPAILVANAATQEIHVQPHTPVVVQVTGMARHLPDSLISNCPNSHNSPLDNIIGQYLHGKETTVYVRGASHPPAGDSTPPWLTDIISSLTLPIPVRGHSFGRLIRNFSLTDTHFGLPDPWAAPGSPASKPRVTGDVRALVALPDQVEDVSVAVTRVRADADVLYNNTKIGELDLSHWMPAHSKRLDDPSEFAAAASKSQDMTVAKKKNKGDKGGDEEEDVFLMLITSHIADAPLTITDEDGFTDVIQKLIFGSAVQLQIVAEVDVAITTALGEVVVRRIPAKGEVPIKAPLPLPAPKQPVDRNIDHHHLTELATRPLPNDTLSLLHPRLVDLRVKSSTKHSIQLDATLDITNPTEYTATVPYFHVWIYENGTRLGWVKAEGVEVGKGRVRGLRVQVGYDPYGLASNSEGNEVGTGAREGASRGASEGDRAREEGRKLLSRFVSGEKEIRVGVRGWEGSFTPFGPPEEEVLRQDHDEMEFKEWRREATYEKGGEKTTGPQDPQNIILGRILQRLGEFELVVPDIGKDIGPDSGPESEVVVMEDDDGEDDAPHFITDATFHLLSSTATFMLLNPLPHDEIVITRLNATALYPHARPPPNDGDGDHDPDDDDPWQHYHSLKQRGSSVGDGEGVVQPKREGVNDEDDDDGDEDYVLDPIGHILYTERIHIPPLRDTPDEEGSLSPRLPVDWRLGSVGYDAVRKALGGRLKLGAEAVVDVKVGRFEEEGIVFRREGGIGAKVRL